MTSVSPPKKSLLGERGGPRRSPMSGVLWTAADSWSLQLINLLTFIILARLLDPSAFGLVAMAGIYMNISGVLVDQGFTTAVIQRQHLEREDADTAFWLNVGIGVLLTLVGIALAPLIARVFRTPELEPVVALLSLSFLINSFNGVQRALLARRFRFKLLAIRSVGAALAGGVVSVIMALQGFGVMALVAQQLVSSFVGVALLWTVGDWVPGLRFSWPHARALASFGSNIVGMRILNAISRQSDDLLIGYFLGPVLLGYYTVAYKIFRIMVSVFTKIISKVALPTFAALQTDHGAFGIAFCRSIKFSSLAAFPMFVGVGVAAPLLVPTLFGPGWEAAIPVMQVLAAMGMLQAVHVLVTQAIIAAGKPSWTFRLMLVSTVLNVIAFVAVVRWGIVMVAVAYTIVGYLTAPVYVIMLHRLIGVSAQAFTGALRTAAVASGAMALAMLLVRSALGTVLPPGVALVLLAIAGLGVYAAVAIRIERWTVASLKALVREISPRRAAAAGPGE